MRVNASTVFAGLAGSLVLSSAASAAYTGISLEAVSITDTTMVIRLFANFDAAGATVVNVFNAAISADHAFVHNEPFGLPAAALLANFVPNAADLFDSWVSIGLSGLPVANSGGSSTLDPNFSGCGGCFADGSAIDNNAGWFNSNPPNNQGAAGAGGDPGNFRVVLAQFAFTGVPGTFVNIGGLESGSTIALTSTVGTFQGQEVSGQFQFTPAPGALALLGIAGLASRRRRA